MNLTSDLSSSVWIVRLRDKSFGEKIVQPLQNFLAFKRPASTCQPITSHVKM